MPHDTTDTEARCARIEGGLASAALDLDGVADTLLAIECAAGAMLRDAQRPDEVQSEAVNWARVRVADVSLTISRHSGAAYQVRITGASPDCVHLGRWLASDLREYAGGIDGGVEVLTEW